jgi:hypothetical protein
MTVSREDFGVLFKGLQPVDSFSRECAHSNDAEKTRNMKIAKTISKQPARAKFLSLSADLN